MKITKNLLVAFAVLALVGCASLYTGVVTLTSVVDAAMKDWAQASMNGQTTLDLDQKVIAAHDRYRKACGVAKEALVAYKNGGDQAEYISALQAARVAASGLIDLIVPLVTHSEGTKLTTQLSKAIRP